MAKLEKHLSENGFE